MNSVKELPEAEQVQVFDALRLIRARKQEARMAETRAWIAARMPAPADGSEGERGGKDPGHSPHWPH